ncbi:MAG: hypothetical protein ACYC3L_06940 [Gemmatimonadaceae bacterium]
MAVRVAAAQGRVADEGSFTVSRDGDRVGREDFSIRHVPTTGGAFEILTRGVVVFGAQRRTVDLSADSAGLPARFQAKTIVDGRATETYRAEVLGRRLSARSVRGDGESAREILLPPGALLVEDGVLHLLQFVVGRGAGASVPAVVPSRGIVVTLTVQDAGPDHVAIALQSIEAHKYLVREGTAGAVREVWVDGAGRLLKVALPAQRLVAVRDEAPRGTPR